MNAAQQALVQALIEGYHQTQMVVYLAVAGGAVLAADYLHTLPDEIRLIWPAPLSLPKVLFFIVRYYVMVNCALVLLYGIPTDAASQECKQRLLQVAASTMVIVILSEAILFVRLYGFSGEGRRTLVFLVIIFLATNGGACVFFAEFYRSIIYIDFPIRTVCMPASANHKLFGGMFALFLSSVTVAMLGMLYIIFRKYKTHSSSLLSAFSRDGAGYFLCLSALATANLIISFVSKPGYKFILSQPEANLHAILSTRILLHLRSIAEREQRQAVARGRDGTNGIGTWEDSNNGYDYPTRRTVSAMQFA